MSPCAHSQSKAGGFRHRTARGCWPEGKVPSGRAAAKDAARRSMRRMYRHHGDWQKLRALFHAAKAALRAASQKNWRACGRHPGADRGAPPAGVSSVIGTTRPSCIRCAAWRIGPPKDPELHAYMTLGQADAPEPPASHWPLIRRPMIAAGDFLFAPSFSRNLRLVSEGEKGWLPLAPAAPTRVRREAPARSARPCSAPASRSAGRAGAKRSPRPDSRAPALKRKERP